MGKRISEKPRYNPIIGSDIFKQQVKDIYDYGFKTFGYHQAVRYRQLIRKHIGILENHYFMFPECRYLPTKDHRYRNILLPAHRIIYRITPQRIEILAILHLSSSVNSIRKTRSINIWKQVH